MTRMHFSPNNFSTAETFILITKLKIYILKLIYGSYNLKLNFILDPDCVKTRYVRVVIVWTVNAWCLRVTYFATLTNVPWPAMVTLSCGSETELAGQVVTDVSTCGHMWKLVLNLYLERLGVILRQTNPADSVL
jgi:hypothetical protein